jgi:hypothetical protein
MALIRGLVLAAANPAIADQIDAALANAEAVGDNAGRELTEEQEVAILRRLLDLLPLSAAERRQITQLFASTEWLPAPAELPEEGRDLPPGSELLTFESFPEFGAFEGFEEEFEEEEDGDEEEEDGDEEKEDGDEEKSIRTG